ncbi:putative DNA ligase [Sphingobium sp. SYK-6]|uniref:ATP-dependent DNA ligase n=1 Tax=Sphingobium sp. (strain NBRC 103272 / SYK-6) TaxID=627192 RepID=UPI000227666D|nr:ATP-dependent DNA ligase [Sphingobium sp. SYK-6]BAK65712.1 putative DNA ligase [Sphingobium sp. SYK-6]
MAGRLRAWFDDLLPMEARLVAELPSGDGWQFEPKWDGFRVLILKDGPDVELKSKSGKSLTRFFPELAAAIGALGDRALSLDGEIILPVSDMLSFDALQQRLHPAASRIARLSRETPAEIMLFDVLHRGSTRLADRPLEERRTALEAWHATIRSPVLHLSPMTRDARQAKAWLDRTGGALDGIVAKRRDAPYRGGERAMAKIKQQRTADCVVGGFREADGAVVSLLLGLYGPDGKLNHVGFTSAIARDQRRELRDRLLPLVAPPGFTGKAPGGPSRWSGKRTSDWLPIKPSLVVEVRYDQVTGGRFRHGTRLLRWRPDKAPEQCTSDQLEQPLSPAQLGSLIREWE